jgi:vacuolar-type H+-ATPase subunit I/STV1
MPRYSRVQNTDSDVTIENVNETENGSAEEDTFKKRYGDLRRHMQQTVETKDKEVETLRKQIKDKEKEEFTLPTSEEEIDAWANKYPEVANIVDSIAQKRAREASNEVEQSMSDLRKMKQQLEREKAEHELKRLHPDFDSIRTSKPFHEWVAVQPQYIQDALYKNENDAVAAARAVDLYKADNGMIREGRSDSELKKEAARSVKKGEHSRPSSTPSKQWSDSKVAALTAQEFEKFEEEIHSAMQAGAYKYDMSGAAR